MATDTATSGEAGVTNRLRELRKRHGVGQAELAKLTGLSRTTVYLLETGQRKNPSPGVLKTLANFFGVSRSYLLGYDDEEGGELKKGSAPGLLGRLRELEPFDRRLLLRGLWPTWTDDAEADARGMELANQFLRESGASADELRRVLVSLDPAEARKLISGGTRQVEAEAAYQRLLFQAVEQGELGASEAADKASAFNTAA